MGCLRSSLFASYVSVSFCAYLFAVSRRSTGKIAVEPPFGEFTDPNKGRNPHGIPPWIVKQVNEEIVAYYDKHGGDPEVSEADEYAFYWGDGVDPDEYPPIYKLPKEYCVYVLECDPIGFDEFSGAPFASEILWTRAEGLGYELSDDWVCPSCDEIAYTELVHVPEDEPLLRESA